LAPVVAASTNLSYPRAHLPLHPLPCTSPTCALHCCTAISQMCHLSHSHCQICLGGASAFGSGNVVRDNFVKWLCNSEERKWGWRTGVGVMRDGLAGRKDRRRQQQQVPRLNHHPWRKCSRLTHHPWKRRIAEVKPLESGLKARQDRGG
jgi:hypothetical protein